MATQSRRGRKPKPYVREGRGGYETRVFDRAVAWLARGGTQTELAKRSGLSVATLADFLSRRHSPTIGTVSALDDFLRSPRARSAPAKNSSIRGRVLPKRRVGKVSSDDMRVCRHCHAKLPISSFYTNGPGRAGRRHTCKQCTHTIRRQLEQSEPERVAHRKSSVEACRNKRKSDYRAWCQSAISRLRYRSEKDGVLFSLTPQDLLDIFPKDHVCPVLGVPFVLTEKSPYNPSVDRLEPSGGYVRGNVAIISRRANTIKHNAGGIELLKIANWVNAMTASQ